MLNVRCINWVCTDAEASTHLTYRGVQIEGAFIVGNLDLRFARIDFPLSFRDCSFIHTIDLSDAEVRAIDLDGSLTGPIDAAGLSVKRGLRMGDGFEARGQVDLTGAQVGGDVNLISGKFLNKNDFALVIAGVKVTGSVWMGVDEGALNPTEAFRAEGVVNLIETEIGVNLNCDGGQFLNLVQEKIDKPRYALIADGVIVKGSVFLRKGFEARGAVSLVDASIGKVFACDGGNFSNPGKNALIAAD